MDIMTAPKGREEMRLDILKTTLEPDNISVYWILCLLHQSSKLTKELV
ncbi:hypothetical protein NC652_003061 [Populus alba x Populus x berolinensis]|nr:hypothetical protein NC652_003061 [Populus alba x Populus x berolinensis]